MGKKTEIKSRIFALVAGGLLTRLRLACGYSQQECAAELKSTQATLSRIEHGVSIPSAYFLQKVTAVLEVEHASFIRTVASATELLRGFVLDLFPGCSGDGEDGETLWDLALERYDMQALRGLVDFTVYHSMTVNRLLSDDVDTWSDGARMVRGKVKKSRRRRTK